MRVCVWARLAGDMRTPSDDGDAVRLRQLVPLGQQASGCVLANGQAPPPQQ
jgi:hypothetical protein